MNYTQNEKIAQVKETTLVVGIDVGSEFHYARAFDWRGYEYSKAFKFSNTEAGFTDFMTWMLTIKMRLRKLKFLLVWSRQGTTGLILENI